MKPPRQRKSMKTATLEDDYDNKSFGRTSGKVTSIGGRSSQMKNVRPGGNVNEVCVIKPTTVEDSREITDTLLSNRTVVLNVEGLDMDVAQRIIDFTVRVRAHSISIFFPNYGQLTPIYQPVYFLYPFLPKMHHFGI